MTSIRRTRTVVEEDTERDRAGEGSRQKGEFYRLIAQNIPDGDICLFDRDFRYLAAEGAIIRHAGRDRFIGHTLEEAVSEEMSRFLRPLYTKALAGEEGEDELHYQGRIYRIRTVPIRDEQGRVYAGIAMSQDITRLKHTEQEVARLNRELEKRVAERTAQLQAANAELEAFAYSVSHDLRAPLRRIDGFGQALLDDCWERLEEDGRHYIARIRASSQHMGELIDDLLDLSRVSRLDVQTSVVDLSAMAQQILARKQEHEPERQVAITVAPGLRVRGDESFLWIALENLLDNAWKFTNKTDHATIEVGVVQSDGEQAFFVRDNGAGFDPAYSAKLFETFNRLHSPAEFPGTGIGLTTVRRVIERHGGHIWAEGAVDQGATFYFTLPAPGASSAE